MESPDQLFYHGKISRVESEQILGSVGVEGSYLVRTSSSTPGDYALTLLSQRRPQHFQIKSMGEVGSSLESPASILPRRNSVLSHLSMIINKLATCE